MQKKAPKLLARRWRVPENGQRLMRGGKNSANASDIRRPDRNTVLHFRLRHMGKENQKKSNPD